MTAHTQVIYSGGDPYVFDADSGEWVEVHHNEPTHTKEHR